MNKIGFEPMIDKSIIIFKIIALNHSATHSKFRVVGFEPTIFYAQDKYDNLFRYTLTMFFYVNKIKKAIINANKATASVNAKPKIV